MEFNPITLYVKKHISVALIYYQREQDQGKAFWKSKPFAMKYYCVERTGASRKAQGEEKWKSRV